MGAQVSIKRRASSPPDDDLDFCFTKPGDAWEFIRLLLVNNQITEASLNLYGEDYDKAEHA